MNSAFDYLKARWAERTTRIGLVTAVLSLVGLSASPEEVGNIAGTIGFIVGVIAAAWPDATKK